MKVNPATILTILYSCGIASARLQSPHNRRPAPDNVDSPGGICTRNSDCQATIRSQSPGPNTDFIGPDVCDCYGTSSLNPFDECQGESNRSCSIAGCAYDMCQGYEGYCQRASNGVGTCALRPVQTNVDNPGGTCSHDNDCQATLRTQTPDNKAPVGPEMCDCYGASIKLPFDECQGEGNCPIAGCQEDMCQGQEAFCQRVSDRTGECALRPVQTNVDKPGGTCTKDSDCHTQIRYMTPAVPTGYPNVCDCYGASHQLPFDECEGQSLCVAAMCPPDSCEQYDAWCQILADGTGECAVAINHHESLTVM